MADIYIVIINDNHVGLDVEPFTREVDAVSCAEQAVLNNARHPDMIDADSRNLTDSMIREGWVWHCRYSTEDDSASVVRKELR